MAAYAHQYTASRCNKTAQHIVGISVPEIKVVFQAAATPGCAFTGMIFVHGGVCL